MSEKKKKEMKQETVQLTLLEVTTEEQEREPVKKYSTKYFEIKTTDTAVNKTTDKAVKTKKVKKYNPLRNEEEFAEMPIYTDEERKLIKIFLSHLWVKWREIERLPITKPYIFDKLNYQKIANSELKSNILLREPSPS